MKHKARIVAASILVSSTVVFLFLFVEFSTGDDNKRYYDTKIGALQGHIEVGKTPLNFPKKFIIIDVIW